MRERGKEGHPRTAGVLEVGEVLKLRRVGRGALGHGAQVFSSPTVTLGRT